MTLRTMRSSALLAGIMLACFGLQAWAGEPDQVLARIGDRVITLGELQAKLGAIPESVRARLMAPDNLRVFLRGMVLKELFSREGRRIGLDKDPEVRARLEDVQQSVLYNAYTARIQRQLRVEDKELKSYFEAHRGEFGQKNLADVKAQVAEKVREAKLKALMQAAEEEAAKRWGVTVNEALLGQVRVDRGQDAKLKAQEIDALEQRVGPLPEETKRAIREGGVPIAPLQTR